MYKIQVNINNHWATVITTNKSRYAHQAFKRYSRTNQPAMAGLRFRMLISGADV